MNAAALRRAVASARCSKPLRASASASRSYASHTKDPQLGDYPELPPVSRGVLPPTGWWDNQMRRNYGDTLHEKDEMFSMWGPDPPRIEPSKALFQFSIAASLFGSIMLFAYAVTPAKPVVSRQYPYDGLVNELGGLEENKAATQAKVEEE